MSIENRAAGCCSCEAVKVLITLPVKGCVHCHCHRCRHTHGAAFVTWLSVSRDRLRLAGREHLRWFSPNARSSRGFCGNCGTHILFLPHETPHEVHVTRACIFSAVEIAPRFHIFFDQHVEWCEFVDALPRLGGASGIRPLPMAPGGSATGHMG
jgi:hypothetical protein